MSAVHLASSGMGLFAFGESALIERERNKMKEILDRNDREAFIRAINEENTDPNLTINGTPLLSKVLFKADIELFELLLDKKANPFSINTQSEKTVYEEFEETWLVGNMQRLEYTYFHTGSLESVATKREIGEILSDLIGAMQILNRMYNTDRSYRHTHSEDSKPSISKNSEHRFKYLFNFEEAIQTLGFGDELAKIKELYISL